MTTERQRSKAIEAVLRRAQEERLAAAKESPWYSKTAPLPPSVSPINSTVAAQGQNMHDDPIKTNILDEAVRSAEHNFRITQEVEALGRWRNIIALGIALTILILGTILAVSTLNATQQPLNDVIKGAARHGTPSTTSTTNTSTEVKDGNTGVPLPTGVDSTDTMGSATAPSFTGKGATETTTTVRPTTTTTQDTTAPNTTEGSTTTEEDTTTIEDTTTTLDPEPTPEHTEAPVTTTTIDEEPTTQVMPTFVPTSVTVTIPGNTTTTETTISPDNLKIP